MVDAAGRVDGRLARAERTRGAIVEALLALNHEGDLKPTGERIAERAGVSLRALWANFKDMEALFSAAGQRLLERQDAEYRQISPQLPLKRRVDEFCRQRGRMLEIVAPSAVPAATLTTTVNVVVPPAPMARLHHTQRPDSAGKRTTWPSTTRATAKSMCKGG